MSHSSRGRGSSELPDGPWILSKPLRKLKKNCHISGNFLFLPSSLSIPLPPPSLSLSLFFHSVSPIIYFFQVVDPTDEPTADIHISPGRGQLLYGINPTLPAMSRGRRKGRGGEERGRIY
jgi:hypothetical protein